MVKCPLGCFLVYSSLLVARMRESVCTNRDFFAPPSVHAEIRQGCQLSDTFRVGIRDVFHCRRHKDYHVAQLDSGRIVGTGQGTRMKGFIFRYKPTHAVSFLSRPYVTLRNSPQVTVDLV